MTTTWADPDTERWHGRNGVICATCLNCRGPLYFDDLEGIWLHDLTTLMTCPSRGMLKK